MATTRLRKAFRYPESRDNEPADGIDEQEQEELITKLQSEDDAKTSFYKKAFLAVPALSLIPCHRALLASISFSDYLTAALSIMSLAASAYTLYAIPLERASLPGGSRRNGSDENYLQTSLPRFNGALCLLLCLNTFIGPAEATHWVDCLPALVLVLICVVRSQLAPIDIAGLRRQKYMYKGP